MKICFLVRSMETGGAERQISLLARRLAEAGHDVVVMSFYSGGALESEFENTKVTFLCLNKKGRWDVLFLMRRAIRSLREFRPDIIHSYLEPPNIVAALLKPWTRACIVWGIRASALRLSEYDWTRSVAQRTQTALCRVPDLIIANSQAGRAMVLDAGFPDHRVHVVYNGVDVNIFHPDRALGAPLRQTWLQDRPGPLFGLIARLDPQKGHPIFLLAARAYFDRGGTGIFVCIGPGPSRYRQRLQDMSNQLGLGNRIIWAGLQQDMTAVYNALDFVTLTSSFGEGFPNVLAEAMACGVVPVATDIGDSRWVLDKFGRIVPPDNPAALASAWLAIERADPEELSSQGVTARRHICDNYGNDRMVEETLALYRFAVMKSQQPNGR